MTYQHDGRCIICIRGMKRFMKCEKCGRETNQKDNACVICKIGIEKLYGELKALMKDRRFCHMLMKYKPAPGPD